MLALIVINYISTIFQSVVIIIITILAIIGTFTRRVWLIKIFQIGIFFIGILTLSHNITNIVVGYATADPKKPDSDIRLMEWDYAQVSFWIIFAIIKFLFFMFYSFVSMLYSRGLSTYQTTVETDALSVLPEYDTNKQNNLYKAPNISESGDTKTEDSNIEYEVTKESFLNQEEY
jgi:hypothetical protein